MTDPEGRVPQRVMTGIYWRFDGDRFADRPTFSREVRNAQIEVMETNGWRPQDPAIPRGVVRVSYSGTDPAQPYDYVDRTIEIASDDGRSFSAEELLFKLHNVLVDELREADHRYFEGLSLKGIGSDGVAEYELLQGS